MAALDVVVEAGAGVGAGDLLRAGPPREELLDHVERPPHRARRGVRPEVARAVLLDAAGDGDARPVVLDIDPEVRVVLVVLEPDVEDGLVALDQRRFEHQRLRLVGGHDVVERLDLLGECAHLRLEAAAGAEVGADARPQALRLADVEHLGAGVLHDVDAGALGEGAHLLEHGGAGHASSVAPRGSSPAAAGGGAGLLACLV